MRAIENFRLESMAEMKAGWNRLTVDQRARNDFGHVLNDIKARDVVILKNTFWDFRAEAGTICAQYGFYTSSLNTVVGCWLLIGRSENLVRSKAEEIADFQDYREEVEAAEAEAAELRAQGHAALRAEEGRESEGCCPALDGQDGQARRRLLRVKAARATICLLNERG